MIRKHLLTKVGAVALTAAVTLPTLSTDADARWRHRHWDRGDVAAAAVIGGIAGLALSAFTGGWGGYGGWGYGYPSYGYAPVSYGWGWGGSPYYSASFGPSWGYGSYWGTPYYAPRRVVYRTVYRTGPRRAVRVSYAAPRRAVRAAYVAPRSGVRIAVGPSRELFWR